MSHADASISDQTSDLSTSGVFTIAPNAPFLRTLADALIDGTLVAGYDPSVDPFALADSVIYLPTRRAARGLGIELLEAVDRKYGGQTVLLPKIRTLGDLDEDEIRTGFDNDTLNFMSQLPAALRVIPPAKRHISLARFVQTWIKAMSPQTLALFEEEKIVLPSSSGDALRLAKDLSHFMDQIEAEEADWDLIKNVAADEFNEWWQLTLSFLSIIMDAWPRSLAQDGFINPSEFRNQVIDFRIRQLTENPPAGPVIAAGTTGSVAATTRLLTKINEMENGAIVLPGFDTNLPQIVLKRFREIDTDSFDNASSSHPQYGMVRLLDRLHTQPSDVVEIGQTDPSSSHRCKVTNTIMLPAEDTAHWIDDHHDARSPDLAKAFETVSIIEAKGQQQEGLSIAIALRKVLETQGKTAALITPDRKLARRVSTELERFGIQIDDSAGSALSLSQPAMFVRQILRCVFSGNDPASLSAVIKSKYLHTLKPNESPNNLVDLFELLLVRSAIVMPDLGALGEAVARQKIVLDQDKHVPKPLRKLSEETWQSLGQFAESLSEIFAPLVALSKSHSAIAINDLMQAIELCLQKVLHPLGQGEDDQPQILEDDMGGSELLNLMESYKEHSDPGFLFHPVEAVSVFDALISGHRTRQVGRTHPRLHIYGTLEARLQSADVMILGGLNEGTWPQNASNDPYLNRPMRAALDLPLPERRIGLAAHDFCQFSGAQEVIYTRALRIDDAPSIASRWLQRLATYVGQAAYKEMVARGDTYLQLSDLIDKAEPVAPSERPQPKPPVSTRPNRLSFTEIETWIRDPYAIYAKHVLKLYALPPLVREADPALRGTLYHDILAKFVEEWNGPISRAADQKLEMIAADCFDAAELPTEIDAAWRPRFNEIGKQFLKWEASRRETIKTSFCEIDADAEIGDTNFFLRGRADRIDLDHEGKLTVIDYKTGTNPSKLQARTTSPQLTLEGALASRGAFEGVPAAQISQLLYVRLKEGDAFKIDDIASVKKNDEQKTAGELAEFAYEKLIDQIIAYRSAEQGYISQYIPAPGQTYKGDYDHLARIREWSIGAADDEGEED